MIKEKLSNNIIITLWLILPVILSIFVTGYIQHNQIMLDAWEQVRTNQTDDDIYDDYDINSDFYIDTNIIIKPDAFKGIFKDPQSFVVREHHIKIDKEMDIISKFIKSRNNRSPIVVSDLISYQNLPSPL